MLTIAPRRHTINIFISNLGTRGEVFIPSLGMYKRGNENTNVISETRFSVEIEGAKQALTKDGADVPSGLGEIPSTGRARDYFPDEGWREIVDVVASTSACRLGVFLDSSEEGGNSLLMDLVFEWAREGVAEMGFAPMIDSISADAKAALNFRDLANGGMVSASSADFSADLQAAFKTLGMTGLVLAPIIFQKRFRGFVILGFAQSADPVGAAEKGIARLVCLNVVNSISAQSTESGFRKAGIDMRVLLDTVNVGVLMSDRSGGILYQNEEYRRLYGWTLNDIGDFSGWWDKACPDAEDQANAKAEFLQARDSLEDEQVYRSKRSYPVLCKDGSLRHTEFRVAKTPGGLALIFADVSALRRAEDLRRSLELQLNRSRRQKIASIERMAGSIAHLFNNQLSVVVGGLELIRKDVMLSREGSEDFTLAFNATKRAIEVSSSMLTYLGHVHDKSEPVSVETICKSCIEEIREKNRGLFTGFEVDARNKDAVVRVNVPELRMVIQELVGNCAEAMPNGGSVLIRIAEHDALDFNVSRSLVQPFGWKPGLGRFVAISVTDTGCGISEDDSLLVFDPFYSTKFQGRGIGLPIALGYVRAWHGAIGIASELGTGATFTIYLPSVSAAAHGGQEDAVGNAVPQRAVLLVDDDDVIRCMTRKMLEKLGSKVVEASSGEEAIKLFSEAPYDFKCVAADLIMPNLCGWDMIRTIRARSSGVPILVISGHEEEISRGAEMLAAPFAVLRKPYSMDDLRSRMDELDL